MQTTYMALADAALGVTDTPVDWHSVHEMLMRASGLVAVLVLILFTLMVGWGFLSFVLAISPNLTERVGKAMHASRVKCFVIGLGAFAFLASLMHVSHMKLGVVAVPFLLVGLAWGLCGVCEDLGRRAWMLTSRDAGRFARVSLGWPIFCCASLMPYVGWFLIFPILGLCGLGAFLVALFSSAIAPNTKAMPMSGSVAS